MTMISSGKMGPSLTTKRQEKPERERERGKNKTGIITIPYLHIKLEACNKAK